MQECSGGLHALHEVVALSVGEAPPFIVSAVSLNAFFLRRSGTVIPGVVVPTLLNLCHAAFHALCEVVTVLVPALLLLLLRLPPKTTTITITTTSNYHRH